MELDEKGKKQELYSSIIKFYRFSRTVYKFDEAINLIKENSKHLRKKEKELLNIIEEIYSK